MTPSIYQQAIYDFVTHGRGDGAVNAVAGSGKTTTLIEASKRFRSSSVMFLAFNNSIVDELKTRLGKNVECRTINSLGHGALTRSLGRNVRVSLDKNKYRKIVANLVSTIEGLPEEMAPDAIDAGTKMIRFAQSFLTDVTNDDEMRQLAFEYAIGPVEGVTEGQLFWLARRGMRIGEEMARRGEISYDDQIWLTVKWKLPVWRADFVMVDEAQDLSPAKLELVLKARAPGGRILFVGDPNQAIYRFAGADSDSFEKIVRRTNATELPLSVCYRCPTTAIARAQKIVPEIQAAPNAIVGTETYVRDEDVAKRVAVGDLILCRMTAPLVRMCVKLIAARVPARMKGRDIGKALTKLASDALRGAPLSELNTCLDAYLVSRRELFGNRDDVDERMAELEDRVEGLRACREAFPDARTIAEFGIAIDGLFSDGAAAVELSTVHRAKGLEADRVWILEPDTLPMVRPNQHPSDYKQEKNLEYVAYTRTKRDTFIVDDAAAARAEEAAKREADTAAAIETLEAIEDAA